MTSAREAALKALISFRRDGAWPDLYLKDSLKTFSKEDSAFISEIVYGVVQNLYLIDYYISSFSSIKLNKIMPQVLDALRCGVYQIVFMDKVPFYAAINETVTLVKKRSNPRAAGFCNAILHKIADSKNDLPKPDNDDLSVIYSCPQWLINRLTVQLGRSGCENFLKSCNTRPKTYIRVNTILTTTDKLISDFNDLGIKVSKVAGLENTLFCIDSKALAYTDLFKKGLFYIQDASSQLSVTILDPVPGDNLIDMCAAPGGKSFIAAQMMNNQGSIKAFDLYEHKTDIIKDGAKRLSIKIIDPVCGDSALYQPGLFESADKIICDVPCSGIGIIRKKPDIRYKDEKDIKDIPLIQKRILDNAAAYLKPGGRMVYSTCTVLKEENQEIVESFLRDHDDFYLIPFENSFFGKSDGELTLYPHINDCDGFFISLLGRKKNG